MQSFCVVLGKGVEHVAADKEDTQPQYRVKDMDRRQEYLLTHDIVTGWQHLIECIDDYCIAYQRLS